MPEYTYPCHLHTSHFTLHTSHFTLHTLHFTLHTSHFTLHASHFTALTIAHHSCTLTKPSLSFSPQHARSSILHLFVTSDGLQSVLNSKPDPDIPQQTTLARHFTLYPIYILSPPTITITFTTTCTLSHSSSLRHFRRVRIGL
jgi:hypothetical protein